MRQIQTKKGAITTFIIIGIILLVIIGSITYVSIRVKEVKVEVVREEVVRLPLEAQPIYLFVEQCIKEVATPGIYLLGIQGGHIYLPPNFLSTYYGDVSYGYFEGRNTLASISEMEFELSSFVGDTLLSCIDDFSTFKEQGKNLSYGNVSVGTIILSENVFFEVDFPVTLFIEGGKVKLEEPYKLTIPIRLGHIHNISEQIVRQTQSEPGWIDLTLLSSFDVYTNVIPHDAENLIYAITQNTTLREGSFVFMFASKFVFAPHPQLILNDSYELVEGEPFYLRVEVLPVNNITIEAYSALFNMSAEGIIDFTPEIPGQYDVEIRAIDELGRYDSRIVRFIIAEK